LPNNYLAKYPPPAGTYASGEIQEV
jgi:hypothetical protein